MMSLREIAKALGGDVELAVFDALRPDFIRALDGDGVPEIRLVSA
jgi:hypothetical protein